MFSTGLGDEGVAMSESHGTQLIPGMLGGCCNTMLGDNEGKSNFFLNSRGSGNKPEAFRAAPSARQLGYQFPG